MKAITPYSKLLLLTVLYTVQGLPYGFQAKVLPLLLREQGASLTLIGLLSLLALPWMFKLLWAPLVDRYHWPRLGRRRSWILPMQALMVCCAIGSGIAERYDQWTIIFCLTFMMNCCAATQDIAVDGWAVELLDKRDIGLGNAAQVSGFKIGMLFSGGILLYLSPNIGTAGIFFAMAALISCALLLVLANEETQQSTLSQPSVSAIWKSVRSLLQDKRCRIFLLVILTYKMGETLNDSMFKPFLFDAGITKSQLGLILGVFGMFFSISGSIAGGFLVRYTSLRQALWYTSVARIGPLFAQCWLALQDNIDETAVELIIYTEHFFGGALTTVIFAAMMARVNKEAPATQFTAFATIEVLGKVPLGLMSGIITEKIGYAATFAVGGLLSIGFLGFLPFLKENSDHPPL